MRAASWPVRLVIAAALCFAGAPRDAGAAITITLEWGACGGGNGCSATGSSSISANHPAGGQTLRLDVYLTHDETSGLIAHTFSLNFDTDLGNELNLLGPMPATEWAGSDVHPGPQTVIYGPFTAGLGGVVESTGGMAGRINSFDSASVFGVLPANNTAYSVGSYTATAPARYRVGQVFFAVNSVVTDGADIFAGAFNGLFDVSANDDGDLFPPNPIIFGVATLNLGPAIPEPGTISLLGLGLVALALAARRSRV